MSTILDRIVRGAAIERRSAPPDLYPRGGVSYGVPLYGLNTATGQSVTTDQAMELVAVYGAVSMLSGAVGSLPLKVYTDGDPREEARGSRQWRMLHDQPNDEMAADEFWEYVQSCLLLWGNAFIWKKRRDGVVQELWPIVPSRVGVGREIINGKSVRFYTLDGASPKAYETDVLHIRGLSTDGLVGLSPIQQARQKLANDRARDQFEGTFWKNGMFASAVFTHPNRLSTEAQERLQEQIAGRSGWLEAGQVLTLEEGSDLKNLTMPLEDAQFIQQAGLSDHRVAQLFGLVPPHQWGATGTQGQSMTYQNSEFGGLEFVKWSMRRWLIRIEKSLGRDPSLFAAAGKNLFPEFLVDALLRASTLERYQAYQVGLDAGFLSVPMVQKTENIESDGQEKDVNAAPPSPVAVIDPSAAPADGAPAADASASRALVLREGTMATPVVDDLHRTLDAVSDALDEIRRSANPEPPHIRVDVPAPIVPQQLPPDVFVTVDMAEVASSMEKLSSVVEHALAGVEDGLSRLADEREKATASGRENAALVAESIGGLELAPEITVNVPPQEPLQLTLEIPPQEPRDKKITLNHSRNGRIESATIVEG